MINVDISGLQVYMNKLFDFDEELLNHSKRVAQMSRLVGNLYNGVDLDILYKAGLMHDIGKLEIPKEILNKKGPLTDEEYDLVKLHVDKCKDVILSNDLEARALIPYIETYHERYNGKGYLRGLKGDEIPLISRIIGVCDSIDAILSSRPYKDSLSLEYCYSEIDKNRGILYDSGVVECVISNWNDVLEMRKLS